MSYYNILRNKVSVSSVDEDPEVLTQPSMALTPRQILERFTTGGVNLHTYESSDSVVDNMTDEQFDASDVNPDDVEFFEDEMELKEYAVNPPKVKQQKKEVKNESNDNSHNSGNGGDTTQSSSDGSGAES